LPEILKIYQGKVVRIQDFGVFIKINQFSETGLVPKSQIRSYEVANCKNEVEIGQNVFVKV